MLSCLAVVEKLYQVGLLRELTVPHHIETYMTPVLYHPPKGSSVVLFGSGGETVSGRFVKRVDSTPSYRNLHDTSSVSSSQRKQCCLVLQWWRNYIR